jgi:hypothetical protein
MKKILYALAATVAVACNHDSSGMEEFVTVNINLGTSSDRVHVTDFQERLLIDELIPLETTDSSLLAYISQMVVSGQSVFILDGMQNAVLHYGIDGKFIRKISRQGQGPEEYIKARGIAVANDKLYVSDLTRILQYDLEGKYLNAFRMDDQRAYQLIVNKFGDMITVGSYIDEYMLNVYDHSWNKTANYFPRKEQLAGMTLTRTTYNSLGFYNDGIFVTNYFDPTIYYIKDNEAKPLVKFDFGANRLPDEFFTVPPEEQLHIFTEYRKSSVMGINNVTVTNDWIIFSPEEGPGSGSFIVFYDRKQNRYITNQEFDIPYSMLFSKWSDAPNGYTEDGKYYSIISSEKLREMIEKTAKEEKDYLSKYKFLKGIDPVKMNEDDNPWLVFYTLK